MAMLKAWLTVSDAAWLFASRAVLESTSVGLGEPFLQYEQCVECSIEVI